MTETTFFSAVAAVFGAVVGSFLNVVIWRLPRGENLSRPGSHCPRCNAPIRWFDNVPLLSWVLLRGRCRRCRARISARYPFVEALTAVLFLLAYRHWRPDLVTAALVALGLAALVAISFIDLDLRIIPDRITKPGMAIGVAVAPFMATHPKDWIPALPSAMGAWAHAAVGLLVGWGLILAIRALGHLLLRKEAMGLGDAKLLAFLGALTGPLGVLYSVVIGSLLGAVIGIAVFLALRGRPHGCSGTVEGRGFRHDVDRLRFRKDRVLVPAPAEEIPERPVRLRLVLPAVKVLEDDDARVKVEATVAGAETHGGERWWALEVAEASDEDRDRLRTFAQSHHAIPFGPFLSLGGAASLLYADVVHWAITEWYPRWVRGLVATVLGADL